MNIGEMLYKLLQTTGFMQSTWENYVMILISFVLFFLAISRKFEPLLLVPIAFGMLLSNIPGAHDILLAEPVTTLSVAGAGQVPTFFMNVTEYIPEIVNGVVVNIEEVVTKVGYVESVKAGGLIYYLSLGVNLIIFPPIIFLGVGAMTDFGPMIASPKSLLLGGAAQLGIFLTFVLGITFGWTNTMAASVSIIGGADGPTAIYTAVTLGMPGETLSMIAISAYSYMALIPIIQPPIMRMLTTKKERQIRMKQLRVVSKREKIIFPIVVIILSGLLLPESLPLLGMLMFGNLLKECLVTERLAKTASNELMNIVTIFLGVCVGFKAFGVNFLNVDALIIIALGLLAFSFATMGGIMMAKAMNLILKDKINPLIGNAAVSAIPMAARVSQIEGQKALPDNYLLMHAMGPNVAGVLGSAVLAGMMISAFG